MLEYLLLLLFPRIRLHGALSSSFLTPLTRHLLSLLGGRSANGPVNLAEYVGLDSCACRQFQDLETCRPATIPSTQYGHNICARFTLPHAEHRFSAVISFNPFPAMNRCRFLRYDVFFFGTAFNMPSHISPSDGNDGSESDGIASAANGVGNNVRNGCERRCRKGRLRTGRMGPLSAGNSVCHNGGIGRASAIVN